MLHIATMETFSTFLHEELNAAQRQAVMHEQGPLVVIAGAGSGKTRVITARIAHLVLNRQVLPSEIVALTFTNKAAHEMKERIGRFIGHAIQGIFVGTFHAYCLQVLKKNEHLLAYPFISIIDQDDQEALIKAILQRNNLHKQYSVKTMLYHISHLKNNNQAHAQSHSIPRTIIHNVLTAYEQEKRASKCYDFDDLLLEVVSLFARHSDFQTNFQRTVRHLLVDEYQDTNTTQHALLVYMAQQEKKCVVDSICVVGDEDQSIYSWRGATIANILNFKKDFPGTTTVTIEQNYRSVQPILSLANGIIAHNTQRNPKNLWSEKIGNDRVRIVQCMTESQEADLVAQLAKIRNTHKKNLSIAVLYRTHSQSRALEEALIKNSLAYTIIGGIQFYERKEIKDILAYLRLIVNPYDKISLFRIINIPPRGLGAVFEELLYGTWNQEPFLTFSSILKKLILDGSLSSAKNQALETFLSFFDGITGNTQPQTAVQTLLERTGYISYLKDAYDDAEAQERIDNIKELVNALAHFQEHGITTVIDLLDELALMQDTIAQAKQDNSAIILMTLHAAKGLEFDIVALCGMEEGLLPAARNMHDPETVQEERRLCYVGTTRAKEWLLLTYARNRYSYGTLQHHEPSRFLQEIPKNFSFTHDCSYSQSVALRAFLSEWIAPQKSTVKTYAPADSTPEKIAIPAPSAKNSQEWQKYQTVKHKTYGVGIVQSVDKKSTNTYATVLFKEGMKKIKIDFLECI